MNISTLEHQTGGKVRREHLPTISGEVEFWLLDLAEDDLPGREFVSLKATRNQSSDIENLHRRYWDWKRERIMERDGHKCVQCGSNRYISVDHRKNRSQGGTHHQDNLQTLCVKCHEAKTSNRER